jgi:hypothetical protein
MRQVMSLQALLCHLLLKLFQAPEHFLQTFQLV